MSAPEWLFDDRVRFELELETGGALLVLLLLLLLQLLPLLLLLLARPRPAVLLVLLLWRCRLVCDATLRGCSQAVKRAEVNENGRPAHTHTLHEI